MKTLFRVYYAVGDGDMYFWADSEEQAKELAYQQGMNREREVLADRVWANNITMKYRGYIVQE